MFKSISKNLQKLFLKNKSDHEFKDSINDIEDISEFAHLEIPIDNLSGAISREYTTYHYNVKGQLHRVGAPAVHNSLNLLGEEWWYEGQLHREDGPAISGFFTEKWFKHGKLHREDGPAVYCAGMMEWYYNGKRHREDGPAFVLGIHNKPHESDEWYYHGQKIECNSFEEFRKMIKYRLFL